MKEYFYYIIGTEDLAAFAASITFATLGIVLSLILNVKKRDKQSKETPRKFSLKFLLVDNLQRLVTSVLLIFTFIRFSGELIGMEPTAYSALVIGFLLDKLSQKLKNVSLDKRK